uniref:7TM_GPCR_Srx domain-containing protein n=1 Tax=Panagrellus redivivus TaxID=6233 RepID=A0A7E4V2X4_PANRE
MLHLCGTTSFVLYDLTYAGPITIFQEDFLPAWIQMCLNCIGLAVWYADMFLQVAMAFNRYVTIVFNNRKAFTRRRSSIFGGFSFAVASVIAVIAQCIVPCCTLHYNYKTYSYFYSLTDSNYANFLITLPINTASTITSCFLYILIFFYIHRVNKTATGITTDTSRIRRAKEAHYAVQFFMITVFSTITWLAVQCFPLFITEESKEWMCIMSLCHLVHCVVNSLIFIFYNREFKYKYFKKREQNGSGIYGVT